MDSNSKLIPSNIKGQIRSAIDILTEQNNSLDKVLSSILTFAREDSIKSEAFDTIKNQMAIFYDVINMVMDANDADIDDYKKLEEMVGDEVLDGEKLLQQLEEAKAQKKVDEEKAEQYKNNCNVSELSKSYGNRMQGNYVIMATYDAEMIKIIQEKIDRYDEIDANSGTLFERGAILRNGARGIFAEIGKSHVSKGKYVCPDYQDIVKIESATHVKGLESQGIEVNQTSYKDSKKMAFKPKDKSIYADRKIEGSYSAVSASEDYDLGMVKGNTSRAMFDTDGELEFKASILNDKKEFDPSLAVDAGVQGSVYEVTGELKAGDDKNNVYIKGEGDCLSANADLEARVGKLDDGGYGVKFDVGADATTLEGEGKFGFNVFGYNVELEVGGKVGSVGAGVKGEMSTNGLEAKVNASLGIGGELGIKIKRDMANNELQQKDIQQNTSW